MNIQQIDYVLAIVDLQHFEAAAERCFVTQSTLSTMVGRLEEELGIRIFNRKTKPVSMTEEGERVVERLRIIRHELDELDNVVQELKGEMRGELKVAVIPTIAPYLLPLFLQEFGAMFPMVNLVVKEMTTNEMRKALHQRKVDVGIAALPLVDPDLIERHLYMEPFVIYDCRGGRLPKKTSVKALDFGKLWLLEEGHCLRTQVESICELKRAKDDTQQNLKFDSGSMDSLLRFTRSSSGMTILPQLAAIDLPKAEQRKLVPFSDPVPHRSVGLLTHKYFVKHKLLDSMARVIVDRITPLIPQQSEVLLFEPQ